MIDLESECSYADYLVVVSANSERQTAGIADAITETLRTGVGIKPQYREGQKGWILLDYGDVIVHVFVEDTRAYYDIDRLWPTSPRVPVPASAPLVEEKVPAIASRRN